MHVRQVGGWGLDRPPARSYPRSVRGHEAHGAARVRGGAVLAACLLVASCTSATDPAGEAGRSATAQGATPDAAPDPTAALRERCLSAIPDGADLEATTLPGRTGGEVEAARIGSASNDAVAVLLPQISGMCGWGRWAAAAAERAGVTSLLVNPCGYGGSECDEDADADPLNEVAPAVALARKEYGATRVVLVGTSMGGSLTVMAAAAGADVDAWVDVSGPPSWDGVDLADLADDLAADGVPDGQVVMARSDGAAIFTAARELARAAGVPFLPRRSGHGWELLVDPVDGSPTRTGTHLMELVADLGAP